MAHQLADRPAEAEKIYLAILQADPEQPDATHLLGLIRAGQDRDEEAVELLERALGLYPEAAHFHHNIAGIYRRMGRLQEAEEQFRAAIALKPDYGEAYQGLSEMVRFQPGDALLEQIRTQLARSDVEGKVKSYFHFAAGKFQDDVGEYASAFEHFAEGNRLAGRRFGSEEFSRMVKDVLYVFSGRQVASLEGLGSDSEVPVFIIGMPRSGTTLVEQILASHSSVFGAGELNDMKQIAAQAARLSGSGQSYPNCVPALRAEEYSVLAEEYLRRLSKAAKNREFPRIIDKHPLNFQFVGLILALFPKARIIHTVRDPLDTGLSCFFQNFTKGQDYSFNLRALGNFYNDYRRLMEHWELVFPGRILTVGYEDLLANQEEETRKLISYVGLSFEQDCIEFYKTDRKINTASFLQVRKPLYQSSKQRWRHYREQLQEFARIIGAPVRKPITISIDDPGARRILS